MRHVLAVAAGKAISGLSRLRGGGSAFPGLVAMRIDPELLRNAFRDVRLGVVFVLGSNGKSTTTHMVSEILREHGLSVFTNPSGANLPQGVVSSLLPHVGASGRVVADVAVLEVDEAFAVELATILKPRVVLGLNTQVDQLYRFIDTERVGGMMLDAMALATETVVANRDDPFLATIEETMARNSGDKPRVEFFGASAAAIKKSAHGLLNAPNFSQKKRARAKQTLTGEVRTLTAAGAKIEVGGELIEVRLPARGLHYAVDAAAASATARAVLGSTWSADLTVSAFAAMRPAYGRGEVLPFADTEVTFVMFKNMASLQLNIDALPTDHGPLMVAIDEGTPDMSWIYDISFENVPRVDVVSGDKCWQMALCLRTKGVTVGLVEPDVKRAVDRMRELAISGEPQLWIVNYEVTMIARRLIGFGQLETQR